MKQKMFFLSVNDKSEATINNFLGNTGQRDPHYRDTRKVQSLVPVAWSVK